jgi:hypothetical protein
LEITLGYIHVNQLLTLGRLADLPEQTRGEPSRLPKRDFILMAVIIHKSQHSRSWSSASSNDFQELLSI